MAPTWESLFRQATAGLIEAGVAVRASTSELWAEIKGAAREAGLEIGQQGFALVNEMRSEAAARRTGYESFQRAAPDELFTWQHAAPEANMRPASVRAILPEYLVRFDATYTDVNGETHTKTVTMRDTWFPDMTVGDVHAAVLDAAEGMTQETNGTLYGQLEGVSNLRPVTI